MRMDLNLLFLNVLNNNVQFMTLAYKIHFHTALMDTQVLEIIEGIFGIFKLNHI